MDQVLWNQLIRYDVRDRKSATGFQHTVHLPKDLVLARGQVDYAIRNDQINTAILERHRLRHALAKLHVGGGVAEIARDNRRVTPRNLEHRVGHVNANHVPRRTDPPRGLETINPAAGADIQHSFAHLNRFQSGWRAAPVGDFQNFIRDKGAEILQVITGWAADLLACGRRPGIAITHRLRNLLVGHWHLAVK